MAFHKTTSSVAKTVVNEGLFIDHLCNPISPVIILKGELAGILPVGLGHSGLAMESRYNKV
jgi:hypothetical protein